MFTVGLQYIVLSYEKCLQRFFSETPVVYNDVSKSIEYTDAVNHFIQQFRHERDTHMSNE